MMDEEMIYQHWLDVITTREYVPRIQYIADNYSESHSLNINFNDLFDDDSELAEHLIINPETVIRVGEVVINEHLEPDQKVVINLRVFNVHRAYYRQVRDLRASDMTSLISIEGEIKKFTPVRSKLLTGMFACGSCGFKQEIDQDPFHYMEPLECPKDEGGCGKRTGSTTFKFLPRESLFIDSQNIELMEKREDLRGTQQPLSIKVILDDDLTGDWTSGDIVRITGILKCKQVQSAGKKSTIFDWYLYANHIDTDNVQGYTVSYDAEEIRDYLGSCDNIMQTLINSFCPSIIGWDRVKQVLLLQLVGGTPKNEVTGRKMRSDIHTCLVGDPGTAKSTLAEFATDLIPGSVIVDASGDNLSANGLTATAVKDEFGDGSWSLEGGAVVMAHQKVFMMDEAHLGKPQIIGALHRPMENQKFGVAKAGLNRTFVCEFSGIFVMNPKFGRFREGYGLQPLVDLIDQKTFSAPWRDRIDYFAMMVDTRDEKKDRELVKHVSAHKMDKIQPELSNERMKQLISYIRDNFHPTLNPDAEKELEEKWVEMRREDGVYNRHLLSVYRFAEASAKINCRQKVISEDYDLALSLVKESLQVLTAGYGQNIDMDAHLLGAGKSKRVKYSIIMDKIKRMDEDNNYRGANENELFAEFLGDDIADYIKELHNSGEISYSYYQDVKYWRCV